MEAGLGRICAVYRLSTAQELDLCASELKTPRFLKLCHGHQRLSQHIIAVVPQPADKSHLGTR